MTFEKFKRLAYLFRDKAGIPKAHVGFTRRDDGLFSAVICGVVLSSTAGSEYITVKWGDGHMSRIKAIGNRSAKDGIMSRRAYVV